MPAAGLIKFLARSAKTLRQTADELDACCLTADAKVLRDLAREHTRLMVQLAREESAPGSVVEVVHKRRDDDR